MISDKNASNDNDNDTFHTKIDWRAKEKMLRATIAAQEKELINVKQFQEARAAFDKEMELMKVTKPISIVLIMIRMRYTNSVSTERKKCSSQI